VNWTGGVKDKMIQVYVPERMKKRLNEVVRRGNTSTGTLPSRASSVAPSHLSTRLRARFGTARCGSSVTRRRRNCGRCEAGRQLLDMVGTISTVIVFTVIGAWGLWTLARLTDWSGCPLFGGRKKGTMGRRATPAPSCASGAGRHYRPGTTRGFDPAVGYCDEACALHPFDCPKHGGSGLVRDAGDIIWSTAFCGVCFKVQLTGALFELEDRLPAEQKAYWRGIRQGEGREEL